MIERFGALVVFISISTIAFAHVELGYYWVDYIGDGGIPVNALKIDSDSMKSGYVGQVFTKEYGLLPASIYKNKPHAIFSADDMSLTAEQNIKVICSQFRGHFVWVKTNASSYQTIPNLVPGGTEKGKILYIGRIHKDNGKIYLGKLGDDLAFPLNGHEEHVYDYFEVLTYNNFNDK